MLQELARSSVEMIILPPMALQPPNLPRGGLRSGYIRFAARDYLITVLSGHQRVERQARLFFKVKCCRRCLCSFQPSPEEAPAGAADGLAAAKNLPRRPPPECRACRNRDLIPALRGRQGVALLQGDVPQLVCHQWSAQAPKVSILSCDRRAAQIKFLCRPQAHQPSLPWHDQPHS